MKRKTAFVLSTSIIILTLASSAVWASQNEWSLFKKIEGVLQVQDGVITKIPGEKEKNEIVRSLDPLTGRPLSNQFGAILLDSNNLVRLNIPSTIKGKDKTFQFEVTYKNNNPILLRNNNQSFILTHIPHSNETIMEYDGDLYIVNPVTKKIIRALNEEFESNTFDDISNKFLEKNVEDLSLVWGDKAAVSSDGKRMAFFSNRNIAFDENLNGELWIKDFATGEEYPVTDWRFHILGWESESSIIVQAAERIGRLNVKSRNIEWIHDFSLTSGYSYPYLVLQEREKELIIINLETEQKSSLTSPSFNQVQQITLIEESPWIIMLNAPDRSKLERNLVVINVETGEHREIEPPTDSYIQDIQWLDKSNFIVNVRQIASTKEEAYMVDLEKIIKNGGN